MGTNIQMQCGICSKLVGPTECQILDGTLKEFFETLLIKLNLDSDTTFYICIDCEEKVNSAFNFKCLCVGTEDTISSYFGLEKVDLKRILCDQEKHESAYYDAGLEVCRLCKNFVHCNSVVALEQIIADESLKEIFEKHIPELNLEVTEDPSVCQGCQESLINFANLLFLLFDYTDKTEENLIDTNEQFVESKESVLKKIKKENFDNSTNYRIKMEHTENNYNENIDYEQRGEVNSIEQTELQLKSENIDETTNQDTNESFGTEAEAEIADEAEAEAQITKENHMIYESSCPVNASPIYKCSECTYGTKSLPELIEHTRSHTTRAVATTTPLFYKCKICGFSTREHYLLKLHLQEHVQVEAKKKKSEERTVVRKFGSKKVHKCPECNFDTESSSKFWAHLLTHPNYYFKKVVPSTDEKNQAKRIVFIGRTSGTLPWKKTFKCELCHYIGSSHQDFMNHVLVHVTKNKKKKVVQTEQCIVEAIHYCELCEFRTLSLDELKGHVEVHMQV